MTLNALMLVAGTVLAPMALAASAPLAGDPGRGAQVFGQCAACHSLEPGLHLTGPSLANIWGRKAGTVDGFARYSEALKKAGIMWDEATLDGWLKDPQAFIPDNLMTFPGIKDDRQRADLIAYLKAVSTGGQVAQAPRGGMMARRPVDVKGLDPNRQVRAIRYCGDTYYVTTAAGETLPFWEFNLRFKTDSSQDGPRKGEPVLLRAGMMGDRAFVVFSSPEEISAAIQRRC